jgi:hypothetical protein
MMLTGREDPAAEIDRINKEEAEHAPPVQQVNLQRAQIGLQRDQQATKSIQQRIQDAATVDNTGAPAA